MKKKLVSVLLAVAMVATLAVGCGSSEAAGDSGFKAASGTGGTGAGAEAVYIHISAILLLKKHMSN